METAVQSCTVLTVGMQVSSLSPSMRDISIFVSVNIYCIVQKLRKGPTPVQGALLNV
jgi:hypothetical protein